MDFFLDTADLQEAQDLISTHLISGITTNPTLAAKAGLNFETLIRQFCSMQPGPVSAEVIAQDAQGMIDQGTKLAQIAENVVIKVPLTMEGLKACKALSDKEIMVNVTLCFSAPQAILAAKAGATFISPFIGRLDDSGWNGMDLIKDIRKIYDNYDFDTYILAASIRHPQHVLEAAKAGADICTIPPNVFRQLYHHPLTKTGLDNFLADWEKSGLSI